MQKAWRSIDFRQNAAELPAEVSIAAMCAELRSFSLFCALILLASGARELEPSLKCEKTIRTCEEILRGTLAYFIAGHRQENCWSAVRFLFHRSDSRSR